MNELDELQRVLTSTRIEELCGMPHRTLRDDRKLPEKYREAVINLHAKVVLNKAPTAQSGPEAGKYTTYFYRKGQLGFIEGGLFRRAMFPNGTKFRIV